MHICCRRVQKANESCSTCWLPCRGGLLLHSEGSNQTTASVSMWASRGNALKRGTASRGTWATHRSAGPGPGPADSETDPSLSPEYWGKRFHAMPKRDRCPPSLPQRGLERRGDPQQTSPPRAPRTGRDDGCGRSWLQARGNKGANRRLLEGAGLPGPRVARESGGLALGARCGCRGIEQSHQYLRSSQGVCCSACGRAFGVAGQRSQNEQWPSDCAASGAEPARACWREGEEREKLHAHKRVA